MLSQPLLQDQVVMQPAGDCVVETIVEEEDNVPAQMSVSSLLKPDVPANSANRVNEERLEV